MSAAVKPHSLASAMEHAICQLEENEWIIKGLRKQNDRLAAEKLNVELEASVAVATAKLGQAQAFQRMRVLEDDLNALRNWITGNCIQRDEFQQLRDDHDNLSYRTPV